jgi:hypothetical protein
MFLENGRQISIAGRNGSKRHERSHEFPMTGTGDFDRASSSIGRIKLIRIVGPNQSVGLIELFAKPIIV